MTYQALARKWRPKTFAEITGQEHVVQALGNALTRGRLHHAYLLTGTRGVGKTTIARVLAKSLNCVTGVTATTCGVCPACVDIDAGRFVDLLELDAASNTGVDNMRDILDNARYAPTVGRYKVYLIDEVHMLSKPAFNSMLKTLEEPPEHVKFVLATTEPQKIPVTVLSRCLQFNLKQLSPALIVDRLAAILKAEGVASDPPALTLLARAAQGSMRDALSLLDQAIAYGSGEVREPVVRSMLGVVDTEYVYRLVDALVEGAGPELLAEADAMASRSLSFASALDEMASLFHRIAVAQAVPAALETMDDRERIAAYASRMAPPMVQLAYQICVQGRADLPLAPDEATGFAMTLLRLLAFEPAQKLDAGAQAPERERAASAQSPRPAPAATPPASGALPGPASRSLPADPADWPQFIADLKLAGIAGQLAGQTVLIRADGRDLVLGVGEAHRHLTDKPYADKLKGALEEATGGKLRIAFEVGNGGDASLAAHEKRERAKQQANTEAAFREEPFVRDMLERFDARIRPDSIKPIS